MEPVVNNSQPSSQQTASIQPGLEKGTSEVSLSSNQNLTTEDEMVSAVRSEDTNEQIIENLKEQRDQLRGISGLEASERPKTHKLRLLVMILVAILAAGATYAFLIKPALDKPGPTEEPNIQKAFVLPSDLSSKTSEEKNALNIIALARKNDAPAIVNRYLNKAHLGQSEAAFAALVASYSSSSNGESVELIEKKVGKVDFASTGESSAIAETTSEFDAASLIYKSEYFNHTNNIYLKINLYKPDPTVDAWKMYIFEFKAGEGQSPLEADTVVPV